MSRAAAAGAGFKGNKRALPSKPCQTCGRPMSWRKRWARSWGQVRHCSDRCRQGRTAVAPTSRTSPTADQDSTP